MRSALFSTVGALAIVVPAHLHAWEPLAHRLHARLSLEHAGPATRARLTPHAESIVASVMLPDHRASSDPAERPRHYLDLDEIGWPDPDVTAPTARHVDHRSDAELVRAARQRAQEIGVRKVGRLPDALHESHAALVAALRSRNGERITYAAADLLHLVADAHQPLHATRRYDGLGDFQRGVHTAFEGDVVDRCSAARPRAPAQAPPFASVRGLALDVLRESHPLAAQVLAVDLGCRGACPRPVPTSRVRGPLPCDALAPMARERLELAVARAVVLLDSASAAAQ